MVNLECQSNSFFFKNNQSGYLPKMISSTNLYNDLTKYISNDNDLSIETNLIKMTSSISNDSAIVLDDFDDQEIKYRNSWPEIKEKKLTYFSHSFDLLNQQTISDNNYTLISKYKHPLPWTNHSTSSKKV